jgi:hypothetical protein
MDNFFSSPELYDDLLTKTRNCCGTARSNLFWKQTENEMGVIERLGLGMD